jgi:multisubunit Na+/H+ antiporter MnhC subunit
MVGIFGKFVDLGQWIPVAIVGIILAISGPSMLIAWLKLRQRSLGPILDASGWAINGRMRVNVRLGGSLSQTARLPAHAKRTIRDPYAENKSTALLLTALVIVAAVAVLAWRMGWLMR